MKNFTKYSILLIAIFTDFITYAQPGDDTGGGDLEGGDPPPTPINAKIYILAIAGIIFAYYSFKKYRKSFQN